MSSPPRWKALLLAASGGGLYFLAYLGWGFWPLIAVFLVPFWHALEHSRPRGIAASALAGLVFGAAAYAGGYPWLWRLVEHFLGGDRLAGAALWLGYGAWFALGFVAYAVLFHLLRRRRRQVASLLGHDPEVDQAVGDIEALRCLGLLDGQSAAEQVLGGCESATVQGDGAEVVVHAGHQAALWLQALENGADGVLIFACHEENCQSLTGNLMAKARMGYVYAIMEKIGLEKERLGLCNVATNNGAKFAEAVRKQCEDLSRLGPSPMK